MLRIITLCLVFVCAANSAKILGAFLTPSFSHQIVYQPIWRELSLRGHEVTVITPNPLKDPTLTNLTEIDVSYLYDIWRNANEDSVGVKGQLGPIEGAQKLFEVSLKLNDAVLSDPRVQMIYKDSTKKYDLFLVEFISTSLYGFKDRFNCPMVGISSVGLFDSGYEFIGNPNHPVLNPNVGLPYSTNLNFWQRLHSTIHQVFIKFIVRTQLFPKLTTLAKKYIGDYVRPVEEIAKETSLILVNSNFVVHKVKPLLPAFVEISGIHLKSPKPLPSDLKTYLDDSKQGVIYVSLGTNVKSSLLPQSKLNIFLEVFASLPYQILWKFENDKLPNKPENVHIRKWLPQQDVLGHKNIKLFVTQGGLQSLDEAIINKVPMLIIPFFGDQLQNAQRLANLGAALTVNIHKTNKEEIKEKIMELITNEKYKKTVDRLSKIIQDHPITALDKAVWWIEYVLRHNGAEHLRYEGIDMPLYQYFLLDVIAFIVVAILVLLYILYKFLLICHKIYKKVRCTNIYSRKSHVE